MPVNIARGACARTLYRYVSLTSLWHVRVCPVLNWQNIFHQPSRGHIWKQRVPASVLGFDRPDAGHVEMLMPATINRFVILAQHMIDGTDCKDQVTAGLLESAMRLQCNEQTT